jgi:hypothetical protein
VPADSVGDPHPETQRVPVVQVFPRHADVVTATDLSAILGR